MNLEREKINYYNMCLIEIKSDLKIGKIKRDAKGMVRKTKNLGLDSNGNLVRAHSRRATPEQCASLLAEQYIKYLQGVNETLVDKSFAEVAEEFIENDIKCRRIQEKSKNNYISIINKHIKPYFKTANIRNLKFGDYQKFLNYYEGSGEKLLKDIRMVLISILNFAMNYEYINPMVCNKLKIPDYKPMKKRDCFTDDEFIKLFKTAMHHYFGAEFITLTTCGLRPKELMNLKWRNINFKNRTIKIEDSKTKYSERIIPMCDLTYEILMEKYNAKKSEYVFTQKSQNNPHSDTTISTSFKNLLRECDIENGAGLYRNKIVVSTFKRKLTPYYCRHTFCSNLSLSGVQQYIITRLMGHSAQDSITFGVYTHLKDKEILKKAKPYLKFINKKIEKIKEVV